MGLAERHRRCHSLYLNAGVIDGQGGVNKQSERQRQTQTRTTRYNCGGREEMWAFVLVRAEKWALGVLCPVCPYITEQSLRMGSTPAHHFRWVCSGLSHHRAVRVVAMFAATQIMDNTMPLFILVLHSPSLVYSILLHPGFTLPALSQIAIFADLRLPMTLNTLPPFTQLRISLSPATIRPAAASLISFRACDIDLLFSYKSIMSKRRGSEGDAAADEDMRKLAVKQASLKQDYNDLQRETRALKKRVQRAKLKKDNLMAEVRFLRRRYRHLTRQPSEAQLNAATTHNPSAATLSIRGAEYNNVVHPKQSFFPQTMAANYKNATMDTSFEEEVAFQASRNQPYTSAASPHPHEHKPPVAREFQVFWEPLRTSDRQEAASYHETPKRKSVLENGGLVADLNLSIFKDIPNGFVLPNRVGKPKVSWQDQMALRV